jgi:hypothetical protein
MKKFRGRAVLGGAVVAGAIGMAGFAFTASNTVPATKAGDGSGAVTGYVVSSVHYGLNATDPSKADSVSFTLDSAPKAGSTIKVKVDGAWYSCTGATTTSISCNTSAGPATVVGIDTLQVVVAD